MGAREVLSTIRNWMAGLRRAVLMNTLKSHALFALAGLVSVTLLVLVLESLGRFGGDVRAVLLGLWVITAVVAAALGVVWPILKYTMFAPTDQKLAGDYAQRMPTIRDRVLNALQLLDKAENAERDGVSSELILAAGRGVAEELVPISPASLPDRTPVKKSVRYAMFSSVAAVALLLVFGRPLISAAERVMNPGKDFSPCPDFVLHVAPGDVELVRGDSLKVVVTATGTLPKEVTITRKEKGRTADSPLTVEGDEHGQYTVTWTGLATTFDYWAYAQNVSTEKFTATVQELPAVRYLSVTLTPPAYTGMQTRTLEENVGDISAVVGTTTKLIISSTKQLAKATVEFFDLDGEHMATPRETLELALDGSKAEGQFTVAKSGTYQIKLTDKEGRNSRDAITYRINARPDEAPVISLVEPGHDLEIAADVKVPIVADAADDYGFSKMTLRYYRPSPWDQPGDVPDDSFERMALDYRVTEPGRCVVETEFDLTPLQLLPEDQVMMFVEVWDNDRISGPKRAKSEMRVLRFPSMAEIFEQQEQMEEKRTITLQELLEHSQDLREDVEKAVEEYKSNPEMSYERKQEINELMEQQEQMTQVLEQVSQAIQQQQMVNQMRALYSPEVMEKMQQIQELVDEVITPEMREAMRKLSEAMQQPSPEEMRKALENFQKTQEQFNLTLDQTLNMLKQMQAEKKLDELSRRLDELSKQQDQLNEKMEQNTPQNSKENAEQQKKLSDEMKKIEQEMKELAEQMKKDQLQGQQQAQELEKQMEQEQLSEQMEQNSQPMQMCQNQSAKKQGKKQSRKMSEFSQMMQNMRQQMQTNQDMETLMEMEKARDKMLDLSMRQEQLWQQSQEIDQNSPQMQELVEEQENLKQAMKRVQEDMQELAKKSMAVTPKMMATMEETINQMQAACNATAERDARTATHYRKQAMAALNEALRQQNNACKQCQSQCNKPNSNSTCNKAGGMCQKQGQINQQTMSMMQNPGSLSQSQAASMQRLAGEQEALAKSMEELQQEAAASKQTLGRLDGLKEDMEDVAKDLRAQKITPETIERQNKIESKLLDFQRANREREFSPQRESNTGIDMVRASPRELPKKPGSDELREDLLRALDAKYTPDYEELVRKYFEALSKFQ
ncbi:MAG: hypothetical protein KDB65_00750 [Calditrichaeota bacterium]|nr:hypothetical protein [Calditrichota bacterium]MCB9369255.1 hypothetical protein [Calditrichota bacterium]